MVVDKVYHAEGGLGPSHYFCLGLVQRQSRVLEFGTATGYMTRLLCRDLGCRVTGFEYSAEAAAVAAPFCEQMIVGDIEDFRNWEALQPPYDAILFADVLEHLRNPETVLARCRRLLTPDGHVIISVPNIAHWSIRYNLLRGRFDYTDIGILDNTHLRFFTLKTLAAMLTEAGFIAEGLYATTSYPPDTGWFRKRLKGLTAYLRRWLERRFPLAMAFQYVVLCRPGPLPGLHLLQRPEFLPEWLKS